MTTADARRLARTAAGPLAIFAASRAATVAAAFVAERMGAGSIVRVLSKWDGDWYLGIAGSGYPAEVPAGSGPAAQSTIAFFPGYPLAVRAASTVTGLAPATSGILVSMGAGALAAAVLWFLVRRLDGEEAATRSVALWAFFPGAFVLSMVYSEGLFLLCATVCLLALLEKRWIAAGAAAALGGAVRPNGIVLAACCLWAAAAAVRRGGSWKALAAPALAPLGLAAHVVFLARHTGDALAWVHAQQRGWGQGIDFGLAAARSTARVVAHPLGDLNLLVSTLTLAVAAAAGYLLWRWRPPLVLAIYSAGMVLPFVLSHAYYFSPRSVLAAFPLVVAAARVLRGPAFHAALGVSAALMAGLLVLSATTIVFTP